MSRYTQYYIITRKEYLDETKVIKANSLIKEKLDLYDDYVIIVSEKWKFAKLSKILFGEDYEIEKFYREYNVYAQHIVSIIKATRSILNTNYYRDIKKDRLITSILDLIEVLK